MGLKDRAPLAIFALVLGALLSLSHPRPIGDAPEYLAVADNLSRLAAPSLTEAQVRAFGIQGRLLTTPWGSHDTIHFWIYPAFAALPVRVARLAGIDAAWGFAAVNVTLLLAAAALAVRRLDAAAFLLLFLGPVVWWVDKVHTEAFTFSLLAIALCTASEKPILAGLAVGVAAAQNPPIAIVLVLIALAGWVTKVPRRPLLIGVAVGAAIAATHPAYYWARYGRPFPLAETAVRSLSRESFLAVLLDSNIGLAFNDPWLILAVLVVLLHAIRRRRWLPDVWQAMALACAATFLSTFGRVVNLNHGGTPGMSRHALWLMPLAIPFLPRRGAKAGGIAILAVCSAVWTAIYFRPSMGESFLTPTRASLWLWTRHPTWTNPPPEIFAERLRHRENVLPATVATDRCEKILLWNGVLPATCPAMAVPPKCASGPCYANRESENVYSFVVSR